jgi:GNAT superfamily N-acetyltransferase
VSDELVIRPAGPDDIDTIYGFIEQLAAYEREPDAVTGTPEMLREALFGERPAAEALLAEQGGEPVGFALFHGTFSTWECNAGLWLEDLYVTERVRGDGVGYRLITALAALAVQRGCSRLEWVALDWNEPALNFYARLGAERLSDWQMHRLQDESLRRVAAADPSPSPSPR